MSLYPGYGVRNDLYVTGEIIQMKMAFHQGSDQGVSFLGNLPYPYAPPLVDTNPPVSSFEQPNPPFPNPAGIPSA